ncbi:MAG: hypothetical protein K9H06_20925, partial [Melioribacteraceae bacterium]|nr:hypothetical protein [Melioribacteraceae bacterium]
MKRLKLIVSTLVVILCLPLMINAQNITMTVIEPLPEIPFAAFAMANSLEGAPRMFYASITGNGEYKLRGSAGWSSDGTGSNYTDIFVFTTENFTVNGSRTVYNDDLGSKIPILETDTPDDDAIEENIRRGKPTGRYLLTVQLLDASGNVLASADKDLVFTNPAQTLIIRSPETASFQGVGAVIAEWDEVIGASSYIVRANVRSNPSQSLEEALDFGSPIIDSRDVGNTTTVNLRTILSREWAPGQEIVLQVSAVVPGLSGTGDSELSSEIINFYLYDPA